MDAEIISASLMWGVAAVLYLVPVGIAYSRDHYNTAAIGVLNVLLGWTTIGWIIALIWSFTDNTPHRKAG